MKRLSTGSLVPRAARRALIFGLAIALGGLAAPAEAATVLLRNGERLEAERVYPTVMSLVVLAKNFSLRVIPVDQVESVDGTPVSALAAVPQAGQSPAATAAPGTPGAGASPAASETGLFPLQVGTFRTYRLEQSRTTWRRNGRTMVRLGTDSAMGVVREVVAGADPEGPAVMRESVVTQMSGKPARVSSLFYVIDRQSQGYFLLGQSVDDPDLVPPQQTTRISTPPMLWPASLSVGQTWTVGPYRHLGLYTAGRLQVVGRETVSVPGGLFPGAYKVKGVLHVFGGSQQLRQGRLETDHGTLETTIWFVPGVGPVKETAKYHAHQRWFPKDVRSPEAPVVVEQRSTRVLTEHGIGGGNAGGQTK